MKDTIIIAVMLVIAILVARPVSAQADERQQVALFGPAPAGDSSWFGSIRPNRLVCREIAERTNPFGQWA